MDLPDIQNAILRPETVALRNVNQAQRIIDSAPKSLIERHKARGYDYDVSPSVVTPVQYANGTVHDVEVAVAIRLPKGPPWRRENRQAYLIADSNLEGPIAAINSQPNFAFGTAQSGTDVSDEEIDLILNKIEKEVERLTDERRWRRIRRLKFARKAGIATVISVGAACALVFGVWNHRQSALEQQAAERVAAEQADKAHWDAIAAFDGKGYVIKSELVAPGEQGPALLDRNILAHLDEAPPFEDLLDNPRKFTVRAGDTQKIASVPPGKGVRVTTNGPEGHVVVNVLQDGSVWIMAIPEANQNPDDLSPTYDAFIQSSDIGK